MFNINNKKINTAWRKYIGLCILLLGVYPGFSSAESVNIISNFGFESGTSPWIFYTNGAGSFLNDAPGSGSSHAGHIKVSQQGTNIQLYQNNLILEPNTVYKLDFKAYSNTGHDLSVSLLKHVSPFTNYGLSNKVVNLGTAWGAYSFQFTTAGFSGTVKDARLMFWLAAYDTAGDQYYFDDVILTKVSSTPPTQLPPTITTQPSSKTVGVGQTATFTVAASGTAPLSYQWQKNDANIAGATGATYTTPATTSANSGDRFRVVVSNAYGKATSNEAILTVTSSPPPASNKQLVLIDETYTHTTTLTTVPLMRKATDGRTSTNSGKAFSFFNFPSWVPDNFVSPVNYAQGTIYQRIQVISKPSTKAVQYQLCLFQDQIIASKHACTSAANLKFTAPGTYYSSQSMPTLYQYNNVVWSRYLLMQMLVVKDASGVPVDDRYGYAGEWSGSPNLGLYYPMKVRYTAIIVPPGGGEPVWP